MTPVADLRPLPRGLALYNGQRTTPPVAGIRGMVLNAMAAKWSTIEPKAGTYDFRSIATALAYAESLDLGCDLRIFAGIAAPDYLKSVAGSVAYQDGQDEQTAGQCVAFWRPEVVAAWENLHRALAAEFGSHPLLRSVGQTLPMTGYAEPFMRGNVASRKNLYVAGLSDEVDLAVHKTGIDIHARVWRPMGVRLRIACNPWMSAQTGAVSAARLADVLDYAVAQLDPQGVIVQNNSIRTPGLTGQYPAMYELLDRYRRAGSPLGFQTASDTLIGDKAATLEWAVQQGAHWVEPCPGAWKLPASVLSDISDRLAANAVPWDLVPATVVQPADTSKLDAEVAALRTELAELTDQRDRLDALRLDLVDKVHAAQSVLAGV